MGNRDKEVKEAMVETHNKNLAMRKIGEIKRTKAVQIFFKYIKVKKD